MSDMQNSETTAAPFPQLTAALFIIMICLPCLFGLLGYDRMEGFIENRTLASFPREELHTLAYQEFARKLDGFVSDHFGFRPLLIFSVNKLKLALHVSPASSVILGREGWLYNNAGPWDWDEYRGTVIPDVKALQDWRSILSVRAEGVRNSSGYFLMVSPPQKGTIYPQFLPDWLHSQGKQTRRGQFFEAMKDAQFDLLDLTPTLLAAKTEDQRLYYQADTHWNRLGAFWGSKGIVDYLHSKDPRVPWFRQDKFTITPFMTNTKPDGAGMDLTMRLGFPPQPEQDFLVERIGGWTTTETVTHQGRVDIFTYTKDDPSLLSLVVVTDSYGFSLHRVLAEHFRRAVFINWWPESNYTTDRFPLSVIQREKPDIAINLRFEGGLLGPINPSID